MERIWQNIKQLPDLLSTTIHSAILKTVSHYIRSAVSACRCLSDLFSSVRDNEDAGIYFQSHSIPFRAVKAKASLLSHKMVKTGRGLLLKAGSPKGACWGPRRVWVCVYPKTQNPQPSWAIRSLTCVSSKAFIQSRGCAEVTSTFASSPPDLRRESTMTASHTEVANSQLDRQRGPRQMYY